MTATKKKQPSKPASGGTLMSMRSGFKKLTTGDGKKKAKGETSFKQVFYIVAAVALIVTARGRMARPRATAEVTTPPAPSGRPAAPAPSRSTPG